MELAFTILGGVAGLIALLLPAQGWRQRAMHILYGATIVGLAYWVSFSEAKLNRVASIERAANRMVVERDMHYTPSGFVQATLAFLEKNKDLYPDTYQRALKMCERYKCDQPGNDLDMITLAYAMQGLLTGLATIDSRS